MDSESVCHTEDTVRDEGNRAWETLMTCHGVWTLFGGQERFVIIQFRLCILGREYNISKVVSHPLHRTRRHVMSICATVCDVKFDS